MKRGFTLVEVAVAVAVLASAGVALQRLAARSVRTIDDDARRARTLLVAQARLADAAVVPPPPGRTAWTDADGLDVVRDVSPTDHPALVLVHVRVTAPDGGDASDLVELVYAPAR